MSGLRLSDLNKETTYLPTYLKAKPQNLKFSAANLHAHIVHCTHF